MFNNLFGYDIFGIDSENLHWKENIVRKVRELAEGHDVDENVSAYDSVQELLDSELPSTLAYHIDGDHAYIGISAGFPFDVDEEVYCLRSRLEATRFVAKALSPFFVESIDKIAEACKIYSGVGQ